MTNQEILKAGHAAFEAGDDATAIATLSHVTAKDPAAYAQALLLLGRAYARTRQLDQARICLEESYNTRQSARTLYHLGECLYQMGDREGAESCLSNAAQSDETLTDAYILLGVVRKEAGRYKEAVPCFDKALKNDPKAVVARYQIAQVAFELGDMQRAAAQAHLVLQHSADFAPAHLLLANITLKLGDYRQAAVEFCRVLELNGPDAAIYMSLGRAFAHLHDLPQAIQAFAASIEMEPDNELALSAVARLAERHGDKETAGKYFRQLLRFPNSAQLAGDALVRLGLPAEAPPAPKAEKKGKKGAKPGAQSASAAKPKGPAVSFSPPKMIDSKALPKSLPSQAPGRVIGASKTAPLGKTPTSNSGPLPPRPLPQQAPPTAPLDNLFDGLNRLIDRTPLKDAIDLSGVQETANAMVRSVTDRLNPDVVNKVKTGILAKLQPGNAPHPPSPSAPTRPQQPPARPPQQGGPGAPAKPTTPRPKPKG
ncbi:MAG TPA: tetratricopeptide repeat protein [Pantanalinema sp.]